MAVPCSRPAASDASEYWQSRACSQRAITKRCRTNYLCGDGAVATSCFGCLHCVGASWLRLEHRLAVFPCPPLQVAIFRAVATQGYKSISGIFLFGMRVAKPPLLIVMGDAAMKTRLVGMAAFGISPYRPEYSLGGFGRGVGGLSGIAQHLQSGAADRHGERFAR